MSEMLGERSYELPEDLNLKDLPRSLYIFGKVLSYIIHIFLISDSELIKEKEKLKDESIRQRMEVTYSGTDLYK